jgi:syntaxin 16
MCLFFLNRSALLFGLRFSADSGYKQLTAGGIGIGIGGNHQHHDLALVDEEEGGGTGAGIQLTPTGASAASAGRQQQPPAWVKHVDAVEKSLLDIRAQMDQLQSMHSTRLGSVFGRDLTTMEAKIEQLTLQITGRFRTAEQSLQAIGALTRGGGGGTRMRGSTTTTAQDAALVGANVQRSLAQQLQELSVQFRQSQRKYLGEVQAQKSGGLVPSGGGAAALDDRFGGAATGSGTGGGGGEFFFNTSQQQQQLALADDMTTVMIQSRDQEIVQIARSIEELGSIFKELAVLVIDQGTILDRIDYNMEAVVESTKTGIKQLEKAEQHQKNARPLRCIVCLSVTIFVLLVILILKHRPRRGWF